MALPTRIDPCPILESVLEVRFSSKLPGEAVFGTLYAGIRTEFPDKPEKLPILELPEAIRAGQAELRFKPYYRLTNQQYILQVGPNVVTLSTKRPYPGWTQYLQYISRLLEIVRSSDVIDSVERVGLRYINFFEGDVLPKVSLAITIAEEGIESEEAYFRALLKTGKTSSLLQVVKGATVTHMGTVLKGSVIDIDTSVQDLRSDFMGSPEKEFTDLHDEEKKLFFKLLKPEFLQTLNPVY